jgi:hypothetical protein
MRRNRVAIIKNGEVLHTYFITRDDADQIFDDAIESHLYNAIITLDDHG